jgi:hypothetical protein
MATSTDPSGNKHLTVCVGDTFRMNGEVVTVTSLGTELIGFTWPSGQYDFLPLDSAGELLSPV